MGKFEPIAEALLELLPSDGTPALNRVLRVMMARQLGHPVTIEDYLEARSALQERGVIGVTRGQGGKVFLLTEPDPQAGAAPPAPATEWSEAALMPRLALYLETAFRDELDLPEGATFISQDISRAGPRDGQWTRPDFLAVTLVTLRFMPQQYIDVHTFELKPEQGGSVQAVHEALAQTRFSHFGHLVWHLPPASPANTRLGEIEEQCSRHGVGLILIRDPKDPQSFETRVVAARRQTPAIDVDGFLASRLSPENQKTLRQALRTGAAL